MYIQVRDNLGGERFIEEEHLESSIASGEIVAFRRSDGWITVPAASFRGKPLYQENSYAGQERRRSMLSKKKCLARMRVQNTNSMFYCVSKIHLTASSFLSLFSGLQTHMRYRPAGFPPVSTQPQ
ncbi:GSU3473 family protein [Geobacter sp. OR-1]|uniref:GSU3473 family protein n=1 Tax=Geobacter sp. OR-1 TaxID=1266765 RepID=UPI00351C649C